MATGLLALLDDVATLLDDVAVMTKTATTKTAGILGDDLAVSTEQVDGVDPKEEIPVVLKIGKGSLINKAIIVPLSLLIVFFVPQVLTYILLLGGIYLSYECFEKVHEKLFHKKINVKNIISMEEKIKGAIKTDFILSLEIIAISLGTMKEATFLIKSLSLISISLIVTFGIYGVVILILKIDDFGLHLLSKENKYLKKIGSSLVSLSPKIVKFLGVIGTIAMFLVGGGIFIHNLHLPIIFNEMGMSFVLGVFIGFISFCSIILFNKIWRRS